MEPGGGGLVHTDQFWSPDFKKNAVRCAILVQRGWLIRGYLASEQGNQASSLEERAAPVPGAGVALGMVMNLSRNQVAEKFKKGEQ